MTLVDAAVSLIEEIDTIRRTNRLTTEYAHPASDTHQGGPWKYQVEFHAAGADHQERAALWANRTGKTMTGAVEIACHTTGLYPEWWTGRRFKKPVMGCVAGETDEKTRDICQKALLGKMIEGSRIPSGTGWIPKALLGDPSFRQSNVGEVIERIRVKHVTGGWSEILFKSYSQGWTKFQGDEWDFVWLDEEPTDYTIFTECRARIITTDGILLFTRTPLFGRTEVIERFLNGLPGTWYSVVGWTDAPHMTPERIEASLTAFPEHERAARANGLPMMGVGEVYPIADELILCDPFEIPKYFRRICGIDFGIAHPAAAAWLAWNPDTDVVYLYDCYKESGQGVAYHAKCINSRGDWIPVAWPHDGVTRDSKGVEMIQTYRDCKVNVLHRSARWTEAKGGSMGREATVEKLLDRMRSGRFKVFNIQPCHEFLEEKRLLHREKPKTGSGPPQIVPVKDDIESAVRYALIDLRMALNPMQANQKREMPFQTKDEQYDPLQAYSVSRR